VKDTPTPTEIAVAKAIGRAIWGSDVEPRGGWLKAARAAIKAMS
jgi:hypothetical protein